MAILRAGIEDVLGVGLPRDAGATADTPVRAVPVDQNDMIIDHLAIELVGSSLGFQSGSLVSGTANSTWKPADGRSPLGHNVGKTEIRIDRVLKTVLAITAGALPR